MSVESDYRRYKESFEEAARVIEDEVLPKCSDPNTRYGLEQLVLYAHVQAQQFLELEMKEAGEDVGSV